jgi:hypothetical protein
MIGESTKVNGSSANVGYTIPNFANCYSSTDLWNWKFEGPMLSSADVMGVGEGPLFISRPKLLHSETTGKFVMWWHSDTGRFGLKHTGVAVSDGPTPCSKPYSFVSSFQPDGLPSYDMGVYTQDDGVSYLIRSVNNQYEMVSQLNDEKTNTSGLPATRSVLTKTPQEAPAMFEHNGTYYLWCSHLTGWSANAAILSKGGSSVVGGNSSPWETIGNPTASPTTFDSQSTWIFKCKPGAKIPFVYMGDRWVPKEGGLVNSTMVWLPITIDAEGAFHVQWQDSWDIRDCTEGHN